MVNIGLHGRGGQWYFCPITNAQNDNAMSNALPTPHVSEPAESKATAVRAIPVTDRNYALPEPSRVAKVGKIVLPTMEGLCFEKVKHIAFLEANGNYTALHFKDKRQVLVCKTLREVEQQLPTDSFARIHRSHTVNLQHLKKYVRGKGGHVVLQNGVTLAVSAGQKDLFLEMLRQYYG